MRLKNRELVLPTWRKTDGAMLAFVIFGTAIPLLLGYGRGIGLTSDDILYAIVFVKYALLYGLFRLLWLDVPGRRNAIRAVFAAEAVVAVLALLQAKGLLGVNELLAAYYDAPFEGSSGPDSLRASSTIASSFGLADSMSIALGLAIALLASNLALRRFEKIALGLLCFLFAAATLAAGSFTGVIGCIVVVLCVGAMTGRLRQIFGVAFLATACSAVILWPTITARLDGFSGYRNMPQSWIGRLDNLERFFWPELFSGWNWFLGVRSAARLPAPESWRDWIYIESGYTWLLWIGGLPMVVAFFYFLWSIFNDLVLDHPKGADKRDPLVIGAIAATAMIAVVMAFDPHLTVRGCADLFFPLLAMALNVMPDRKLSPFGFSNLAYKFAR